MVRLILGDSASSSSSTSSYGGPELGGMDSKEGAGREERPLPPCFLLDDGTGSMLVHMQQSHLGLLAASSASSSTETEIGAGTGAGTVVALGQLVSRPRACVSVSLSTSALHMSLTRWTGCWLLTAGDRWWAAGLAHRLTSWARSSNFRPSTTMWTMTPVRKPAKATSRASIKAAG